MKTAYYVIDDFCPQIDQVRQSALDSGFGSWKPNKSDVGTYDEYKGSNFWGLHSHMLRSLCASVGRAALPNNMFFRSTGVKGEKSFVHSDGMWGDHTCIVYMSHHKEVSGTAFYRHRKTGLTKMPSYEQMKADGTFEKFKKDMEEGGDKVWEQTDFVRGNLNRALIFDAPMFHARVPKDGIGTTEQDSRMVWVCHFTT